MVKFFAWVFAAFVFITGSAQAADNQSKDICHTDDPFPYTSPYTEAGPCPKDIQDFIDRVNGCGHFMGEEATDAERKADIDKQMADLKCKDLGCDFNKTFGVYEGDIVYTGILTEYVAQVFGDIDNLPACPDQEQKDQ